MCLYVTRVNNVQSKCFGQEWRRVGVSPNVREFGFRYQENFLLVESGIQGNFICGIRKAVQ